MRNRGELRDWQDLPEEEVQQLKQDHLSRSREDQQGSIEEWIDYLASDKSSYLPDHLKYWAFSGMLQHECYKKAKKMSMELLLNKEGFPGVLLVDNAQLKFFLKSMKMVSDLSLLPISNKRKETIFTGDITKIILKVHKEII